jgi:hypothetical protein
MNWGPSSKSELVSIKKMLEVEITCFWGYFFIFYYCVKNTFIVSNLLIIVQAHMPKYSPVHNPGSGIQSNGMLESDVTTGMGSTSSELKMA